MTVTTEGNYQTRDGGTVKIYATGLPGLYPVHGAIFQPDHCTPEWEVRTWTADGRFFNTEGSHDHRDLVEIPEKKTIWVEVLVNRHGTPLAAAFNTEEEAKVWADADDRHLERYSLTYEVKK
jgi:hypothetical protein